VRVLVLGAGATGGYFGGRLAATGRDVTFLVRPERAHALQRDGLVIESPMGNVRTAVTVITPDALSGRFDVILLTCKAFDLADAMATLSPAMSGGTCLLPLLNGVRHLDLLDSTFGRERVLGGLAKITATLRDGAICHLSPLHTLVFGPRHASQQQFAERLASEWQGAGFDAMLSEHIEQEMWEKWVLIATLAGSTCLMRAAIGDIVAEPAGEALILAMVGEASAIAAASGHSPRTAAIAFITDLLTDKTSTMMASMLRDLEGGRRTEVDHILGDLIDRGQRAGLVAPSLSLAWLHVKAATRRRLREARSA
jgi:2-dehydropantoate 2-reductase